MTKAKTTLSSGLATSAGLTVAPVMRLRSIWAHCTYNRNIPQCYIQQLPRLQKCKETERATKLTRYLFPTMSSAIGMSMTPV